MAAGNFDACLKFVLKYEGGRSEDPHDPGGKTMEGITQGTYSAWLKKKGRPNADVFEIPAADRDAIYHEEFWLPIKGDQLRPGEDLSVFDFAVNSGPHRALEIWRETGGPTAEVTAVVKSVCDKRLVFMKGLRTWQYFGAGWQTRVSACKTAALKMTGSTAPAPAPGPVLTGTGAVLTGAGSVINYLQAAPAGQALVLVLTGAAVMAAALFASWKSEPPGIATPSLPVPISVADQMAELIRQQQEIFTKMLVLEPQLKAEMEGHQKLLDQIHSQIVVSPAQVPPPQ